MIYQGACDRAQPVCDMLCVNRQTDIDESKKIKKVNSLKKLLLGLGSEGHRQDEVFYDKFRYDKAHQGTANQG